MGKFIFIRHAESAANAGLKTGKNADIPLTDHGRIQASNLAASIVEIPSALFCSPFRRALDTAAPILAKFPKTPFIIRSDLRELVYLSPAKFDGTTTAERAPAVADFWRRCDPDYCDGPDAESFAQFVGRVKSELDFLAKVDDGAIAVSHGQFMTMARLICEKPSTTPAELMRIFLAETKEQPVHNTARLTLDV
jgi:broad specificity phosphatase PhoE